MGLAAIGSALLSAGRSAISFLAPAATTAGRVLANPAVQGAAGATAASFLFGGGGSPVSPVIPQAFAGMPPSSQLTQLAASGAQVTSLANGQFMAIAPNGDMQIFNRNGQPRKPTSIIPAGQRVPGGSIVVATRQNGAQIGVVKTRRRRRFAGELKRTKDVIMGARSLMNLCKPPTKRK